MKTDNSVIPEKISDNVGTRAERLIINSCLSLFRSYSKFQLDFSIGAQQQYIEGILYALDFLYQFYDLDPIYFSLLDHAIRTLEKLASADDQKEMLAEYCNRAAVVFQTAADKTRQDPIYKRIWSIKAREYINKACAIMEMTFDVTHEERIMQLYKTFAEIMPHEFIKNLLLDNYKRYEDRYKIEEFQTDTNGLHYRGHNVAQDEELTPLLNQQF
ncbi:MAG: hypothetical protein HWN81_20930 [Candidatus Lokiarchaeota archaeon]|nr:hypothetical protein [Candidatus Lokiarchaeota archaeon]